MKRRVFCTAVVSMTYMFANVNTDVSDIFPDLKAQNVPFEVEIKIQPQDDDRKKLIAWLEENCDKKKIVHHEDIYFDKKDDTFFFDRKDEKGKSYKDALRSVRIRLSKEKGNSINTKLKHCDKQGRILKREEHEVALDDEQTKTRFKELSEHGYVEVVRVKKKRTKYTVGKLEVTDDELYVGDGVKRFIEIEHQTETKDAVRGKKDIYAFLRKRGILTFKQYYQNYLVMMLTQCFDFYHQKTLN